MSKYLIIIAFLVPFRAASQEFTAKEIRQWEAQAKQVQVIRDDWGIPHIYGQTDADAVFGLMYAQCEDDFKRVEMNYIEKLGRMAEIKGKVALYDDLLIRLLIDSSAAKSDYRNAPGWLRKLLQAFSGGINYYLYKHPEVRPVLLKRFQPWFPLLWTDGSIGAINTAGITTDEIRNFYSGENAVTMQIEKTEPEKPTGSNGFAIAPSRSASGNALLYINPHVTFYFRPEVHMVSREGLNAYGAVTWGQFFVYQGFNEFCGWMHTSSDADVADLYEEKITPKGKGFVYEYNGKAYHTTSKLLSISYSSDKGIETKGFLTMSTKHGPVMAKRNGKWISLAANNRNMKSLEQSWLRTKAGSFEQYKQVMDLRANTSNNTVYADAAGNIAYWHGNFMPRRNSSFNWAKPVDGSLAATDWQGLHTAEETIHLYNPPNGWLQNCNSTPFTAAAAYSPDRKNYPAYMAPDEENFRGINAVRVLQKETSFTLDKLIAAGYDTYITGMEDLVPALIRAYGSLAETDSLYGILKQPVDLMKQWDLHTDERSIATTLAMEWGRRLVPQIRSVNVSSNEGFISQVRKFSATANAPAMLLPLVSSIKRLTRDFGTWQIPWGEINRYQRITDNIDQVFDDNMPSLPVGFVSSFWGMLPSYSGAVFPNTKKIYGVNGNSFVCAVEFGKRIKARSLLAGGQSGHKGSKHFTDQALMYTKGEFKDVYFYKEDILKHAERVYHPGE